MIATDTIDATNVDDATDATAHPVLLGNLVLDIIRGQPRLTLVVRCPHCRGEHVHGWGFDSTLPGHQFPTGPTHRVPHCWRDDSPFHRGGYLVYPHDSDANNRTLARFTRLAPHATAATLGAAAG